MNDEVIAAGAQKVVYGGGTTAFLGGLTANEIAAFGGLLVAVVGLLIQLYYKRKSDKRELELHEMRKARWDDDEYGEQGGP
jgi:hypothetical protein